MPSDPGENVDSEVDTSRKKKQAQVADTLSDLIQPVDSPGTELFRRVLLGWAGALLVARPLVLGEDPGLMTSPTDTATLVLTILWMLLAVCYAAWCAATKRTFGHFNGVEWGLLATAACVFISAENAARYKHPARIIAWEWVTCVLIYATVRRLAATSAERNGLLATLLASTVSLAAYGIYQGAIELPRDLARFVEKPHELRQALAEQNVSLATDDTYIDELRRRLERGQVFATFIHPSTFAMALVLLLPCLAVAVWVSARSGVPRWQVALLLGCVALAVFALSMTRVFATATGLLLAAWIAAAIWQRRWLWRHRIGVLVVIVLFAAGSFGIFEIGVLPAGSSEEPGEVRLHKEAWRTTGKMIAAQPWWGFGPGNFGNAYPRFMPRTAIARLKDPINFALEMWVSAGLFALVSITAALVFAFKEGRGRTSEPQESSARMDSHDSAAPSPPATLHPPPTSSLWTFYIAGMIGLLIGFGLRAADLPAENIKFEALAAGGRSVLWFAAFALFAHVPWTEPVRTRALLVGAGGVFLSLLIYPGLSYPALAGLLWPALALAAPAPVQTSRPGLARLVPLPTLAALFLFYLLNCFYPVTAAAANARRALVAGRTLMDEEARAIQGKKRFNKEKAADFLRKEVIAPLERAVKDDPDNAWLRVKLADWYGMVWAHAPMDVKAGERGQLAAQDAEKLDPEGQDGCQARYRLFMLFGRVSAEIATRLEATKDAKNVAVAKQRRQEAREKYGFAAKTLTRFLPVDPHNARLRFQLAEAFFLAGDQKAGQLQARVARKLDAEASAGGSPSLTNEQRGQIEKWLDAARSG